VTEAALSEVFMLSVWLWLYRVTWDS